MARFEQGGQIDADGNAAIEFGPPSPNQSWRITTVSVSSDSIRSTQMTITRDGNFIMATRHGNKDTAGGSPEILRANEKWRIEWNNGTPGAQVNVVIQYDFVMGTA